MRSGLVVIGVGQLGLLFSEAFLRLGQVVIPVLRGEKLEEKREGSPALVISAVGEDSALEVLLQVPEQFLDRLVLIQNELRPDFWLAHYGKFAPSLAPTVCVVWFEKKTGQAAKVVRRSVLYGPNAHLVAEALDALGLPHFTAVDSAELYHELAVKNLYILALNFSGLTGIQSAGQLLASEQRLRPLTSELIELELASLRHAKVVSLPQAERLEADLRAAIAADLEHGCAGRTATARLVRTLGYAARLGQKMPICEEILRRIQSGTR